MPKLLVADPSVLDVQSLSLAPQLMSCIPVASAWEE